MASKPNDKYLLAVYDDLNTRLEKQAEALPKDLNKKRFVQNCMTVLTENDFSECDSTSVARTLMKGAYLGLDFFNGECYAINYKGNVSFQTDYKGELKLCKKYSSNPIKDIYAKVVREGDEFEEVIENGQQSVNFKPKAFNNGEILGAFAVCLYKDGSMIYDTMSKEEIENTRKNYSKMSTGPAWTKSYSEIGRTENYVVYKLMKTPVWTVTQYADVNGYQCMCYTIEKNDGSLAIVDGGRAWQSETLVNLIKEKGGVVDTWIITHGHDDHSGVLASVLEAEWDKRIRCAKERYNIRRIYKRR